MSWVEEVAVLGVTEINHSALLGLAIGVSHFHAVVTEVWNTHSTDSIKGNEALSEWFSLIVPIGAGINIVWEICGEAISDLRGTVGMASDTLGADIGPGHA